MKNYKKIKTSNKRQVKTYVYNMTGTGKCDGWCKKYYKSRFLFTNNEKNYCPDCTTEMIDIIDEQSNGIYRKKIIPKEICGICSTEVPKNNIVHYACCNKPVCIKCIQTGIKCDTCYK